MATTMILLALVSPGVAFPAAADPTPPVFPDRWVAHELSTITTGGRTSDLGPSTVYFGESPDLAAYPCRVRDERLLHPPLQLPAFLSSPCHRRPTELDG